MPGNRQIYEQAMNMGHSAAWDQAWDRAIAAYGRAVQEMPEDPAAHNSLGLAKDDLATLCSGNAEKLMKL